MTSNGSQPSTPIDPEAHTLLESLDDTAVLQDGSNLQDTSRHDRGLRSATQPPEPPKTGPSVAELVHHPGSISSVLTSAHREKPCVISVPQHLHHQPNYNAQRSSARERCSISSNNSRRRKRKISDVDVDDEDSENGRHSPAKNIAHKRTEKRYRTNLKDKIAVLRNCVPSLRSLQEDARSECAVGEREDLQDLPPVRKLSKATVIATATEYIHQLEKRNVMLAKERAADQIRIAAFEKLYMSSLPDINPTAGRYGARHGIYQRTDTDLPHTDTHLAARR